ncbi:hypothetical protein FHX14_000030 [Rhizobium sp. BK619]|uniref:hypothetical protein n=1 Tax=Rhizobium sp. BK619 TaxID=2586989 RepID=UPI00161714D9|nr:hypothetical protein [Rhizobium sp. BK619]MBB3643871.1 hypothetical protein [Rhizobium sp. BK619]
MRELVSIFIAVMLSSLCGCAIAPYQEEVTAVSTPQIVRSIRCETRDAIRGQLANYLLLHRNDPTTMALGYQVADRRIPLSEIDLRPLNVGVKRAIARFKNYAVTYDFTFDGTVTNNIDGDLDVTGTFAAGNRGFPFTAKMDRSRQNIQTFRQTDSFGALLKSTPPEYCPDPHQVSAKNYIYPISGSIGMDRQLNDFLSLNEYGALAPAAADQDGPPVFASTIVFKTTIQGTADPTVVISPVVGSTTRGGGYGITSARTDVHQVIVGFAANATKMSDTEIDAFLAPYRRGYLLGPTLGKTPEEIASEKAVANSILRFEIGRQSGPAVINQSIISLF